MSKIGQHIQEFEDDLINMSFHNFSLKHATDYPPKNKAKLKELKEEYDFMREDLLVKLRTVTN